MTDKIPEYTLGQQVETTCVVYDKNGTEVTPTTIKILWGKLVGDLIVAPTTWIHGTNAEITGSGARYTATFTPDDDGLWAYRYEWSGAYTGAKEKTINVRKSPFYT